MVMEAEVKRIDHLGIIAGVIQDLKIIELIDNRISPDPREEITTGEAVAGMIINGLGFSDRPITLTPQFFENKALKKMFRSGINAEHFNRFKLGRALDGCYNYGCDTLFAELSRSICLDEGIDTKFNGLDTTTFSLTGEYASDMDEHTIDITHGYSKDHRPDLKQAVLELVCTYDGGIPVISKSWNGNTSDTEIFRKRAKALIDDFKSADGPRYLVADAKLYDRKTLETTLKEIPFITRVPRTIKLEEETIEKALETSFEKWSKLDQKHFFLSFNQRHYDLDQRWLVVWSQEAQLKAEKRIHKKCFKERQELEKQLKLLFKQKFSCKEDTLKALKRCGEKACLHEIIFDKIKEEKKYQTKGRPKQNTFFESYYQIEGHIEENHQKKQQKIKEASCFIITTTIACKELTDQEVILAYKNQNEYVERGFRFLKDPLMFTSSLFVKKHSRIMGLLMIMTLALLVYAVAQRRVRKALKETAETLPNQIGQENDKPTLRWLFQLLEGIEFVYVNINNTIEKVISGLTTLKKRILSYFGSTVRKIYEIEKEPAPGFSPGKCSM